MKKYLWKELSNSERAKALARPKLESSGELEHKVREIVSAVRARGDVAVREFNRMFDKVEVESLRVSAEEITGARASLSGDQIRALERAKLQIEKFHQAQLPTEMLLEVSPGVFCGRAVRAIDSVGLYVPGGTAPLPSTVLMLAIPAQLAGCKKVVLSTPPQKDGGIHPAILTAASICGVTEVFRMGGAQAIAAMAYGTESVPKVDKIFGPGNRWVTQAKIVVAQDPLGAALDMPAGPSEVMVIADKSAKAEYVAADLLSQAEHGEDSQVILVTEDANLEVRVQEELRSQLADLSRKEIAEKSLAKSVSILVSSLPEAVKVANAYAPEHLILQVESAEESLSQVETAGSVFLGPYTPEAVGDYASGTNHVLPTYGYARAFSGLSVSSFQRWMTYQRLSEKGILDLGPTVEALAEMEGLTAHKNAVSVRLKDLGGQK